MRPRVLPGPLTVREAFEIASNEVQACAREGDDPGDVRSNLTLVDHAEAVAADRARRVAYWCMYPGCGRSDFHKHEDRRVGDGSNGGSPRER